MRIKWNSEAVPSLAEHTNCQRQRDD